MDKTYGNIPIFKIRDGETGAYTTFDLQSGVTNKIDEEINKVQKRISRLDRFNKKSRWISASRHK